jgi:hypothetical protein
MRSRLEGAVVDRSMSSLTRDLAEVIVPLGEEEERRAVETALAHVALRHPLIYGVELRIEKRRRALPRRQIGVLLAELDGYLVHEVVIADDGTVFSAEARPDLVPPFSDEEVAEATVLARTDSRVAELARRWGVRFGTFYPSQHGHDHDQRPGERDRRLVGLRFFDAREVAKVVPLVSVVVDVTGREVVSVEHY